MGKKATSTRSMLPLECPTRSLATSESIHDQLHSAPPLSETLISGTAALVEDGCGDGGGDGVGDGVDNHHIESSEGGTTGGTGDVRIRGLAGREEHVVEEAGRNRRSSVQWIRGSSKPNKVITCM